MKYLLKLVLLVCLCQNSNAQENKVLFTIDDKPFYTEEFVRVYNKNLDLVKNSFKLLPSILVF